MTCLKGYVHVEVSHAKSSSCYVRGNWSCASGNVKYLICHVTSQSHVIEGSCNFLRVSLLYFTTPPNLVAIGLVIVNIFSLSRDLAISRD